MNGDDSLGVVITGGSRGLGYALASEFLSAGDRVVICGRNSERLEESIDALRLAVPEGEIYGIGCDVGDPGAVRLLAELAVAKLGRVDRWINNAGTAGLLKRPLWELDAVDILETCTTNLSGSLALCAEAVKIMLRQPTADTPCYHIFNMGFSMVGASFSRSAVPHKASKRGVAEVTHFLSRELKAAGVKSVGVHELSPGLVLTDLLLRDATEEARRFLTVIAEKPETVASVLVPKIRSISGKNSRLRYEPLASMFFRILIALPRIIRQSQQG
ncbi:MAG: SDR family oxidoreductase [Chlorobium sp.]|nr:MAG: SDR family oxidoreductase [Chlorobium sp.]